MSKEKGGYVFLGKVISIIAAVIIVISVLPLLFVPEVNTTWISMSGIAIGTFIFSLICMDYLTYKSKEEAKELSLIKNIIDEIKEEIKELEIKNETKNKIIKEKLEVKIGRLIEFLELLSGMVGKIDSLICKDIINNKLKEFKNEIHKKIDDLYKSCPQQFKQKKNELVEKLELLKGYIELISIRLPSRDKLALLEEIDKRIGELVELKDEKEKKEKTDELIKLRNKKIELLSEEPVGVLDKHEIRRSLTISLTIVYFMLLFFTVFSPVTTTTQVLNTTDMIPGNITGKITVENVSIIVATEANITLNQTTHTTPNLQSPFVELFTYVYLAVITFYFGSRVIESYIAKKK